MDLTVRIRHAERYPFERPRHSYCYAHGTARPLETLDLAGRAPVIAAGSNAAPERLRAKFGRDAVIPVTRAALHHHAVVYSAHLSSYAAVPATLHPVPGAATEVFVTWLTGAQLTRMHATEGVGQRYDYVDLSGLHLEVEGHGRVERAGAYLGRNGALTHEETPLCIEEAGTINCSHPQRRQASVLRLVHRRVAPDESYRQFMARMLQSADDRRRASTLLAVDALRWPGR